jgi:F-type H+-transporting ATPase subunit b
VKSYIGQLFWLAVYFAVVYVFMRFVGIPRVAAIIQARKAQVDSDLTAAEQLRNAAAEARATYEATMAEAHAKARQLLAETHERNVATLTEQTRAAAAQYEARVAEAVTRIHAASEEALKSIPEVAAALASEITVKLAGHVPGADLVARAVHEAAGREAA